MNHTLNVELFFFNAATDYLPHYKKITCILDEKQTVRDILKIIQERDPSFEYPKQKTLVQINSKLLDARLKIKEIVEVFGTQLTIEPASIFRATKDLRFDDHDFMENYSLLAPYCDDDDLKYYRTLYCTYYASEALKYNKSYCGDALLLLALRLLRQENEHKDDILDIVSDKDNGLWLYEYENNSYPSVDITPEVDVIKAMLQKRRFINSEQMQPLKLLIEKFEDRFCAQEKREDFSLASHLLIEKYGLLVETLDENELEFITNSITLESIAEDLKHSFNDFNIAFYVEPKADASICKKAESLIVSIGGVFLPFEASTKACGAGIVNAAPDIAYKKAGTILLDALDNNADLLIVNSNDAAVMLNTNIKKCEKAIGREIDLQIITPSQLVAIATGFTDKVELGLDKNGSTITFI